MFLVDPKGKGGQSHILGGSKGMGIIIISCFSLLLPNPGKSG